MHEIWLKTNRRAIWFACIPPLVSTATGLCLVLQSGDVAAQPQRWIGALLLIAGVTVLVMLLRQLRRPRMAYHDGQVLFFLRAGEPIAVPSTVVEAFFVGQGPALLPGGIRNQQQAMNLVARLSQRETEWARQAVKPALGQWCDGYVTIRGTWCEPLGPELIRRLNRRLKEVKMMQEEVCIQH